MAASSKAGELISRSLGNLANGVSRQPYEVRLLSQCEEQRNMASLIAEGAVKRAGFKYISQFHSGSPSFTKPNAASIAHLIDRGLGAGERYVSFLYDGGVDVYKTDGTKQTVTVQDTGLSYLDLGAGLPKAKFRAITVGDTTFIVNREATPAMEATVDIDPFLFPDGLATVPPDPANYVRYGGALVWVKRGMNGAKFGFQVKVASDPDWTTTPRIIQIETDNTSVKDQTVNRVIELLAANYVLNATLTTDTFWDIRVRSHVGTGLMLVETIRYTPSAPARDEDFEIRRLDPFGAGEGLDVFKHLGSVQSFSKLPEFGVHNFHIEVQGDVDSEFESFWVKFVDKNPPPTPPRPATNWDVFQYSSFEGVWKETVKPGLQNTIDKLTMPYLLVPDPVNPNTFILKASPWTKRLVGDLNTAEPPSFIGKTIQDIFFLKNRLGFLAGDNMILSEVGEYYNFWPTTVRTILDADPIDLAVTANKRVSLLWGVPFEKSLAVFGDRSQFTIIGQNNVFAPKTVSADPIAEHDVSANAPPASAGDRAIFVEDHGNKTRLRELRLKEDGIAYRADAITDHIEGYIPTNVRFMVASSSNQTLYVVSENDPKSVYVYRWHEVGNQKAQQAWSKYTLASDIGDLSIFGMSLIDDTLHVVWKDDSGYGVLTTLDTENQKSPGTPFLDFYETDTGGYVNPSTFFSLHTHVDPACSKVVAYLTDIGWASQGKWLNVVPLTYSASDVTEGGTKVQWWVAENQDLSAYPVTLGVLYESFYEFSRPVIRDSEENPITTGRMQVRTWTTRYDASGDFEVRVGDQGGADIDDEVYNKGTGITGGSLRVPVLRENKTCRIRVRSENPFDLRLTGAEYEALYFNRASPIG